MLAVIETGGKQYVVREGKEIRIEKLNAKEGDKVSFESVLFSGDEKSVKVGTPLVKGAKVAGVVVAQGRDEKVWGIKHKAKKRYKMKFGHKQPHTIVKIEKIA